MKTPDSVSVSVLIDTYNHEKFIETAIRSVLAQEDLGQMTIEIIVVDDGSTDGTKEVIQSFGDRVKYFHKPNGGQASAFNFGIPLCRGEIICFLDGDDWWHPKKVRMVLDAFSRNEALVAVGHSIIEVDEASGNQFRIGPENEVLVNFRSREAVEVFHNTACCLGTSRLVVRRSTALDLLTIPEKLVFEADEYMFTLLPTIGQVAILPEALTFYRIHGNNLFQASRALPLRYGADEKLRKRASIFQCLNHELPIELRKRGLDGQLLNVLLQPVEVEASRLKLMTSGGSVVENFRSERHAAGLFRRESLSSKAVLLISLALTLVLPPKWYFAVRQYYANILRRIRQHWVARAGINKDEA
jgi:glycosyltransferase involved in cell wall biosynthesis